MNLRRKIRETWLWFVLRLARTALKWYLGRHYGERETPEAIIVITEAGALYLAKPAFAGDWYNEGGWADILRERVTETLDNPPRVQPEGKVGGEDRAAADAEVGDNKTYL